jgi:hypothetical protein
MFSTNYCHVGFDILGASIQADAMTVVAWQHIFSLGVASSLF